MDYEKTVQVILQSTVLPVSLDSYSSISYCLLDYKSRQLQFIYKSTKITRQHGQYVSDSPFTPFTPNAFRCGYGFCYKCGAHREPDDYCDECESDDDTCYSSDMNV